MTPPSGDDDARRPLGLARRLDRIRDLIEPITMPMLGSGSSRPR